MREDESNPYDQLYVEFIYYFNIERDYFECHEVMEELWLEEGRAPLFQGLLQVAVGLYHYRNGNVSGAVKLFTAAIQKLEPRRKQAGTGIALGQLVDDSIMYLHRLERVHEEPFAFYDLDIMITDPALAARVEELQQHPPVSREEH